MNIVVPQEFRIKNTIKFPTSLIVGGLNRLGFEIADSLIEQGGYVVIVDSVTPESIKAFDVFREKKLISFVDYTSIPHLSEDIRRLDYVFYFAHESLDYTNKVSTQNFLNFSNYLDAALSLASKFDAKFLLTSSLKAYQLHSSEQQMSALSGMQPKTLVYNEMEVQRYAESLTQEYFEKAELDTRILRLGDIIGEGIDFAKKSVFNELIIAAAKGDYLRLPNDGLENEWFIHVLDCAYALIKAQFSKNTTGKIFSVCYDTTFTHISIAYKIQEVEEHAKEIQFLEEKNSIPILRIQKPAPNLSTIGWMPRISFDRAVKQSIAAAKIYLVEHTLHKNSRADNLSKFANLVGNNADQPLNRILSNRKHQEALKYNRMSTAAQQIQNTKVRRQRTFTEKFQNFFWNRFTALARTFTFLQRRSPLEVVLIGVCVSIVLFVYFQLISPALVITRNVVTIVPSVQTLIQTNNLDELLSLYTKTEDSVDELQLALNQFSGFVSILNATNPYQRIQATLAEYKNTASTLATLSYGIQPIADYLDVYRNNIQIRNSTDGYLSVVEAPLDYQSQLQEIEARSAFIERSTLDITSTRASLENKTYIGLPSFIISLVNQIDTQLKEVLDRAASFKSLQITADLLGMNGPKTHLIVLLDNTQLKPLGGSISGFALITVDKGGITDITVQPIEILTNTPITISASDLQVINMTRYNSLDTATFKITDLASIADIDAFAPVAREVWEQIYNKNIDGVALLDLAGMESFLKITSDSNIVTIGSTNFANGGSITSNISSVVNSGALTRNQVITNLFAVIFYYHTTNIESSFLTLGKALEDAAELTQLRVDFVESTMQQFTAQNPDNFVKQQDYYIRPGMDVALDSTSVISNQFPDIGLTVIQNINNNNNSIQVTSNIRFPNYDSVQDLSICIPSQNVLRNSIRVTNIPEARVVINEDDTEYCVISRIISESQVNLEFSYQISTIEGERSFNFGIQKMYGAFNTLQHEVSLGEDLTISRTSPNISISDSSKVQYQVNPMNGNIQEISVRPF